MQLRSPQKLIKKRKKSSFLFSNQENSIQTASQQKTLKKDIQYENRINNPIKKLNIITKQQTKSNVTTHPSWMHHLRGQR